MKNDNCQCAAKTNANDPVESALLYEKLYSKKYTYDKFHEEYSEYAILGHRRYLRSGVW